MQYSLEDLFRLELAIIEENMQNVLIKPGKKQPIADRSLARVLVNLRNGSFSSELSELLNIKLKSQEYSDAQWSGQCLVDAEFQDTSDDVIKDGMHNLLTILESLKHLENAQGIPLRHKIQIKNTLCPIVMTLFAKDHTKFSSSAQEAYKNSLIQKFIYQEGQTMFDKAIINPRPLVQGHAIVHIKSDENKTLTFFVDHLICAAIFFNFSGTSALAYLLQYNQNVLTKYIREYFPPKRWNIKPLNSTQQDHTIESLVSSGLRKLANNSQNAELTKSLSYNEILKQNEILGEPVQHLLQQDKTLCESVIQTIQSQQPLFINLPNDPFPYILTPKEALGGLMKYLSSKLDDQNLIKQAIPILSFPFEHLVTAHSNMAVIIEVLYKICVLSSDHHAFKDRGDVLGRAIHSAAQSVAQLEVKRWNETTEDCKLLIHVLLQQTAHTVHDDYFKNYNQTMNYKIALLDKSKQLQNLQPLFHKQFQKLGQILSCLLFFPQANFNQAEYAPDSYELTKLSQIYFQIGNAYQASDQSNIQLEDESIKFQPPKPKLQSSQQKQNDQAEIVKQQVKWLQILEEHYDTLGDLGSRSQNKDVDLLQQKVHTLRLSIKGISANQSNQLQKLLQECQDCSQEVLQFIQQHKIQQNIQQQPVQQIKEQHIKKLPTQNIKEAKKQTTQKEQNVQKQNYTDLMIAAQDQCRQLQKLAEILSMEVNPSDYQQEQQATQAFGCLLHKVTRKDLLQLSMPKFISLFELIAQYCGSNTKYYDLTTRLLKQLKCTLKPNNQDAYNKKLSEYIEQNLGEKFISAGVALIDKICKDSNAIVLFSDGNLVKNMQILRGKLSILSKQIENFESSLKYFNTNQKFLGDADKIFKSEALKFKQSLPKAFDDIKDDSYCAEYIQQLSKLHFVYNNNINRVEQAYNSKDILPSQKNKLMLDLDTRLPKWIDYVTILQQANVNISGEMDDLVQSYFTDK